MPMPLKLRWVLISSIDCCLMCLEVLLPGGLVAVIVSVPLPKTNTITAILEMPSRLVIPSTATSNCSPRARHGAHHAALAVLGILNDDVIILHPLVGFERSSLCGDRSVGVPIGDKSDVVVVDDLVRDCAVPICVLV